MPLRGHAILMNWVDWDVGWTKQWQERTDEKFEAMSLT